MEKYEGNVFNIQRFSVHDGPGIRTTVFLKGCNLRCRWCHNPEAYQSYPQILYYAQKCTSCGACAKVCSKGVFVLNQKRINSKFCIGCGACTKVCLYDAIKLMGEKISVNNVMRIVEKDKRYFDNSKGGLTVSGGEPLLQPEFTKMLFQSAKQKNIHTALDTAANVPYSAFKKVLPYTDLILLDLKMMDDARHREHTGVSNKQILTNAVKLFQEKNIDIHIRVPLIKGVNDSIENAQLLHNFLEPWHNISNIELLSYHTLGIEKAKGIGMEMKTFLPPEEEQMEKLKNILAPGSSNNH